MLRVDIITIFPDLIRPVLDFGILRRAMNQALLEVRVFDLRDFTTDKHRSVDDRPFGGGDGMVFKPEPIFAAVESITASGPEDESSRSGRRVILLSPQGKPFTQAEAVRLHREGHLILICGRYEGVDQRVIDHLIDEEISIGDYVLSGGELPALVVLEAVTRLLPGALGSETSTVHESFASGLLDCPHYTRPATFRGLAVPEVLLGGNHAEIERWRGLQAIDRTRKNRPDLLERAPLKPKT
ncbi:MAG: tRNA (guanosine(37)-N1)-methyltransferase TrmD [Acidobacteria bacterium]|nr:tRNA (guanosine(37)-N1)-methyltransferase TrmD [Acidobacteriota bacterium]